MVDITENKTTIKSAYEPDLSVIEENDVENEQPDRIDDKSTEETASVSDTDKEGKQTYSSMYPNLEDLEDEQDQDFSHGPLGNNLLILKRQLIF